MHSARPCCMNACCGRRRDDNVHPALRPRQGARDHRARQGDDVLRRADDVQRDAQRQVARGASTRRRSRTCTSGGSAMPGELLRGFEKAVRLHDPRGLRAVGDVAGRLLQPPRQGAQGPVDRHADRRRRDEGRRRRPQRRRAGRGRRDRHQGPQHHEGLLEQPDAPTRSSRTAGSSPATWPRWTRTATSSSSTARRSSSSAAATTSTRARSKRSSTSTRVILEAAVVGVPDD